MCDQSVLLFLTHLPNTRGTFRRVFVHRAFSIYPHHFGHRDDCFMLQLPHEREKCPMMGLSDRRNLVAFCVDDEDKYTNAIYILICSLDGCLLGDVKVCLMVSRRKHIRANINSQLFANTHQIQIQTWMCVLRTMRGFYVYEFISLKRSIEARECWSGY